MKRVEAIAITRTFVQGTFSLLTNSQRSHDHYHKSRNCPFRTALKQVLVRFTKMVSRQRGGITILNTNWGINGILIRGPCHDYQ